MNTVLFILSVLATEINPGLSTEYFADFSGAWEYEVETPEGTYTGTINLTKAEEGYEGNLMTNGYKYDISAVEVEDSDIKFNVNVDGFDVLISGTFEGDNLNAIADVQGMEMPFVAKKKK
jgi:hypothetical protein